MVVLSQNRQWRESFLSPVDQIPTSVNIELCLGRIPAGPRPSSTSLAHLVFRFGCLASARQRKDNACCELACRAKAPHLFSALRKQACTCNERVEWKCAFPALFPFIIVWFNISMIFAPFSIMGNCCLKSLQKGGPIPISNCFHAGLLLLQQSHHFGLGRRPIIPGTTNVVLGSRILLCQ